MPAKTSKPLVILIHGIAAHRSMFLYLGWCLWRKGFRIRTWGYRSAFSTIPRHGKDFRDFLDHVDADPSVSEFHIVAHSMGGIVTRQALLYFRPKKLKRFVMLSTPNRGSKVARKLSRSIFWFSKTLRQISDEDGSFVRQQEFPHGVETGAIFANVDRVVTRESSQPYEGVPFYEFYSGHNDLLIRPTTARAVESFLRTGKFPPMKKQSSSPSA